MRRRTNSNWPSVSLSVVRRSAVRRPAEYFVCRELRPTASASWLVG